MPEFEMCVLVSLPLAPSPPWLTRALARSLADDDDEEEDVNQYKVDEVLRVLEADEIDGIDVKKYKADIAFIEGASAPSLSALVLSRLHLTRSQCLAERLEKNNADLAVLQEYRRREEEFRKRGEEFELVNKEWDAAKNKVTELRNERLVMFMKGFGVISNKLKEMYQVRARSPSRPFPSSSFPPDARPLPLPAAHHSRRQCRARAVRYVRPVLRGRPLLRHAPEEDVEEHLEPVGRREDALLSRARLCPSRLQGAPSLARHLVSSTVKH